jgi:membrane-anchored mycosin MYCP
MRRGVGRFPLAAAVLAGLMLGSGALGASGTALASAGGRAAGLPRPRASEWWFSSWLIQSRVWPLTTGAGVTVAVLDSGVQASIPDLRGAVVPGGDMTGAGTNGMTDDDVRHQGHGTAMAALIAGTGRGTGVVGIAPRAKILTVRIGGMNGVGSTQIPQTAAAGIRYAVTHGARVINLSVGVPNALAHGCDPGLQRAVAYALQHNVVVVAGAGDAGAAGNMSEQPASCAGMLAVGGVNPNLTLWRGSERQPYVDVAAPASDIDWSGSDGKYYPRGYGTSQATAFVSGEAALIRARYPFMPWQQVVQRIINTALPRGRPYPNHSFGYGIVRIDRAVNASRYPVASSAPNPVLDAYRAWLKSPARTAGLIPREHIVTFAPQSGLSGSALDGLIILIVAGVVLIAAVVLTVFLVSRRRARRQSVSGSGVQL